jgi:hypothetical protein
LSKFGESVAWVRAHPYTSAGVVFIGGAVLVYIYYSSGSKAAAAADTTQSDYLKAQLTSEATQAQYGAQLQALHSQEQTAAAQVQGAVAIDANRNAAAVSIATLQSTTGIAQLRTVESIDLAQIGAALTRDTTHDSLLYGFMNNAATLQAQTSQKATDASLIAAWIPFGATLQEQNRATFGTGGSEVYFNPATGGIQSGMTSLNPDVLRAQGFTQTQINTVLGVGA